MPSLRICGNTRDGQPMLHDDMSAMWDANDERSVKNYLKLKIEHEAPEGEKFFSKRICEAVDNAKFRANQQTS